MFRQHRPLLALVITIVISSCAFAAVTVKRDPPDVQVKTFDPAKPPAEMPHLAPGEDAATATVFRVQAGSNYEPITRKKGDDGWTTVVQVHGLTITLQLHVTIWVAQGVTEKLKAHEEGHRIISEKVYQDSALVEARAAGAATMDGKRFTGEGPNWKAAAANAIDPVINEVGKAYLQHTADVADEISNIYDDLTQHGSNDKAEDEAIKEGLREVRRETRGAEMNAGGKKMCPSVTHPAKKSFADEHGWTLKRKRVIETTRRLIFPTSWRR